MHYASGVERIKELCRVQNAKIISLYKWNEEKVLRVLFRKYHISAPIENRNILRFQPFAG